MRKMLALLALVVTVLATGCVTFSVEPGEADASSTAPEAGADVPPVTVDLAHDHMRDADRTVTFEVPEGARQFSLAVFFDTPSAADGTSVDGCAGGSARIVVTQPDGKTFADHTLGPGNVGIGKGSCPMNTRNGNLHGPPGTWTVTFTGTAAATGRVTTDA